MTDHTARVEIDMPGFYADIEGEPVVEAISDDNITIEIGGGIDSITITLEPLCVARLIKDLAQALQLTVIPVDGLAA